MKKATIKLQYNSPVVLSFALASLIVLWFDIFTGGRSTYTLFSVYRSSFSDPGTYVRFFLHVLGHVDYAHYLGNMMFILVLGPTLEERYGSRRLFWAIFLTALVSGMIHWLFFGNTVLMGASGIVFMLIFLASLSGMKKGCIPLTLILVAVFYLGQEIYDAIFLQDGISHLTHIIGGLCGTVLGFGMYHGKKR